MDCGASTIADRGGPHGLECEYNRKHARPQRATRNPRRETQMNTKQIYINMWARRTSPLVLPGYAAQPCNRHNGGELPDIWARMAAHLPQDRGQHGRSPRTRGRWTEWTAGCKPRAGTNEHAWNVAATRSDYGARGYVRVVRSLAGPSKPPTVTRT